MTRSIRARPLTRDAFAQFGDVIDKAAGDPRTPINGGRARRLAALGHAVATGPGARVVISLVESDPTTCPSRLTMMERHPLGSQAFVPLSAAPFLVVVSPDLNGEPGTPHAFVTAPHQGVNYHPNIWHGVLTPLDRSQDFLVIDRAGEGANLEEHHFPTPWTIEFDASS